MKKLIVSLITGSMLISTPALAKNPHNHQHKEWPERNERRSNGCGWLCGAIIGGLVVGAISSSKRDDRNPDYDPDRDYDNRYYPPDYRYDKRYCVREQITEWYRGERYVYWETRCN